MEIYAGDARRGNYEVREYDHNVDRGPVRQAKWILSRSGSDSKIDDSRWCHGEGGESTLGEAGVEFKGVLSNEGQIYQLHDHQLIEKDTNSDRDDEPG